METQSSLRRTLENSFLSPWPQRPDTLEQERLASVSTAFCRRIDMLNLAVLKADVQDKPVRVVGTHIVASFIEYWSSHNSDTNYRYNATCTALSEN
jgi:hypothetical protein